MAEVSSEGSYSKLWIHSLDIQKKKNIAVNIISNVWLIVKISLS